MYHGGNCSSDLKEDDIHRFKLSREVQVTLTIIYIIILLIGVSGNLITITVIHVLQKKGYLQKAVTDHMISLACSDLLVLLMGMPVQLYSAIWKPFTSATVNSACKVYMFLFETCSYATIFNVATLSFERYTAICRPFHYKSITGTRTIVIICLVWLASVLVGLPQIFATGLEHPLEGKLNYTRRLRRLTPNITVCTNLADQQIVYQASIYGAFIVYLLILISVAFMCQKMMRTLAAMKKGTVRVTRGSRTGKNAQFISRRENATADDARKQTIIVLGLIVLSLAVCWIPTQIRRIMTAALQKDQWTSSYLQVYITLVPIADTFFYLSSVVNPLLYNISSKQFRKVFMQVLHCNLTIEHVNKQKLSSHLSSRHSTIRSLRPLLCAPFKQTPSKRVDDKASLNIIQSSTSSEVVVQPSEPNVESLEPNVPLEPPKIVSEMVITEHNGLQESEF